MRLLVLLCAFCVLCGYSSSTYATDIEGVQPAALDQPRVNILLRRDIKGEALATGGGKGEEKTINIQAFLDTGASGVMLSTATCDSLGVKRENDARNVAVQFRDVGVGGGDKFNVSEPLYVFVAPFTKTGGEPGDASDYKIAVGPLRAQVGPLDAGMLTALLGGGMDVLGMPAIRGHVIVMDPKPVDSFADTMRAGLFNKNDAKIPATDRHVKLTPKNFARFTRLQPPDAQGPAIAENLLIDNLNVTYNGKDSTGSWLLDTGAAASMISVAQAEKLGVKYVEGTKDTGSPKLANIPDDQQFALDIAGVGGSHKAAGFFLETLTLPTHEKDAIVYRKAPVLISDITVEDPKTKESFTLDGVFGMNYFVASAYVTQAGLMPDIGKMSAGAYQWVTIDPDKGELGLKIKPELAGKGEITIRKSPPTTPKKR